jgi:hypothetical protein
MFYWYIPTFKPCLQNFTNILIIVYKNSVRTPSEMPPDHDHDPQLFSYLKSSTIDDCKKYSKHHPVPKKKKKKKKKNI